MNYSGPDMGSPITSLAISQDSIFAAASNFVGRYVRGKEIGRLVIAPRLAASSAASPSSSGSDSDSDEEEDDEQGQVTLTNLLIFGTTLVALSATGTQMFVWDLPAFVNPASKAATGSVSSTTPYAVIDFPSGFIASQVLHPATYLNKIVVASQQGSIAIWNIRTGSVFASLRNLDCEIASIYAHGCCAPLFRSLIHTFESSSLISTPSAITALAQSPAIDVLGIGFASGQCVLFDVRLGEILGKVRLEGEGSGEITGVAFRNGAFFHLAHP